MFFALDLEYYGLEARTCMRGCAGVIVVSVSVCPYN